MPEQPTIAERIELLQSAVRKWLHLCRYSFHARGRKMLTRNREAWSDSQEIIRDYGHFADDPHAHGVDPETKQEWWIDQFCDLREARQVEKILQEHGREVAAWLAQQNVSNAGAVALFLEERSRSPEVAEVADSVLTVARASLPVGGGAVVPKIIWYHGGKSYSQDGRQTVNVSAEMHNALRAFLDKNIALNTPSLEKAGVSNVSALMSKIIEKFGDSSVRRPLNKGEGYQLNVRSCASTN